MAKKNRSNAVTKAAFVCVLVFLVVWVIDLQMQIKEKSEEKAQIEAEVQQLEDDINELTIRLNTPISDEYIERVARENGFRMPNEIVFYNDVANSN